MNTTVDKNIGLIFSCFTRSFDAYHLESNRIHLISSVLYDEYNADNFKDRLYNYLELFKNSSDSELNYLICVTLTSNSSEVNVVSSGNLIIVFVSLDDLIGHFNFTKKSNELFEDIFGKKSLKNKDFELNSKNCLFIFQGILWSNIVLKFKLGGIDISGGSTSKRHILSSVDYQLFRNIEVFYNKDKDLLKRMIYNSYKSFELSSGIPLDLYNKYLDTSKRISSINYNLLSRAPLYLKELFNLEDDKDLDNEVFSLLTHNLNFSFDILKRGIIKNYEYELENLKVKLKKLNSEIRDLENSITEIEGLSSIKTKYLSTKNKKKHKKELSSYATNPKLIKEISDNKLKLTRVLNKYEEELSEISRKENSLLELKRNLNDKNLNELNNLFILSEKKGLVMNKKNRFIISNSYESPKLRKSYRQYSTTTIRNNNFLITEPIPLINQNKEISLISNNKKKISKELSFYFKSISNILANDILTNKEKQIQIEEIWFQIMGSAYEDVNYLFNKKNYVLINKLKKAKDSLNLMYKKGILQKKFPFAYDYLNDFNLLMITFMVGMNSANRKMGYTATARLLGSKIIQALYYNNKKDLLKESSKDNKYEIINISYDDFFKKLMIISNEEIIRLGDFFLSILFTYPSDVFEREFDQYESYINSVNIKIKININNYQEILDTLIIEPFALPMVCSPNLWSNKEYGGYLLNSELKEELITGSKNHGHIMSNSDSLIQTINYMSSIKFKINEDLLNYIINTNNDILKKELFQGGSSLQNLIALKIAMTYSNQPIYIPNASDWRGRIYTKSFYITYQGNDLSLSLLEFWDGKILTDDGLNSLYIYGANLYNFKNISKDTMEARKNWVKTNINNILKMDNDFINGAENKLVFIAFCLTIRALKKNPNHLVKLPVFLDATCSGIQHLAALMKDKILGSQVNLIKQNKYSKPEDFYSKLLKPINDEIQRVGNEDPKYANLSYVELKRINVKKPIMTKPYNATVTGMKESLIETFEEFKENNKKVYIVPGINNNTVLLSSVEALKIASIIHKIIYCEFPSLKLIYDYFINMAKVLNKLGMPITWFTPSGIKITQKYYKSTQRKVAISLGGKSKTMVLKEWLKIMDKNKQTSAIIPNIIHSLDASHIMQIINTNLKTKNYSIITVHDCFGTHPNNLKDVSDIVKSEFIKLYTQSQFLEGFNNINIDLIEKHGYTIYKEKDKKYIFINENKRLFLPEIPKTGDLNLSDIQYSEHMIT